VLVWGQEAAQAREVLVWGQEAAQAREVLVWGQEDGVEDDPVIPGSAWVWLECGQERVEDGDLFFGKIGWVGLHRKFKPTRFAYHVIKSSDTNSNRFQHTKQAT
jgi:hypothetical protein